MYIDKLLLLGVLFCRFFRCIGGLGVGQGEELEGKARKCGIHGSRLSCLTCSLLRWYPWHRGIALCAEVLPWAGVALGFVGGNDECQTISNTCRWFRIGQKKACGFDDAMP